LWYRSNDLFASFPAAIPAGKLEHAWLAPAVRIYANWLSFLAEQKTRGLGASNSPSSGGRQAAVRRRAAGGALRSP
jgi:hypothetical protein